MKADFISKMGSEMSNGHLIPRKVSALLVLLLLALSSTMAFADFCVSTQDLPCDGNATLNTGPTGGENFTTYYVYANAGSVCNKSIITVTLDNVQIWAGTICGCGTTSFNYPTANVHTVGVKVQVVACETSTCTNCVSNVTPIVRVYTPARNACATNCP